MEGINIPKKPITIKKEEIIPKIEELPSCCQSIATKLIEEAKANKEKEIENNKNEYQHELEQIELRFKRKNKESEECYSSAINKILIDIKNTYQIISSAMENIEADLKTNKKVYLNLTIEGQYRNSERCPSLKYWKMNNPGKWIVVEMMMDKLKSEGWHPYADINPFTLSSDKFGFDYYGGNTLILTCEFTQ